MNVIRHYFGNLFRSLRWGAEAGVALAILTASTQLLPALTLRV